MCLTCLKRGLSGKLAVFSWKPEFRRRMCTIFLVPHVRFGSGMNCTRMWYLYVLSLSILDFGRQKMLTRFSLTALAWVSVELAGCSWYHIKGKSMGYTTVQLSIGLNDSLMVCQTGLMVGWSDQIFKNCILTIVQTNEEVET